MRRRVEALGLQGILTGPNQVRVDRVSHARDWRPTLVRCCVRCEAERAESATAAAGCRAARDAWGDWDLTPTAAGDVLEA
jgi:hypothetical protein